MRRLLVDTSAFIEFFRGKAVPDLEEALRGNSAVLSGYVRLELLQGVRKSEERVLADLLGGLRQLPHREDLLPRAKAMLREIKGVGLNVGIVDLLIAAQAQLWDCDVLSFDDVFQKLEKLGLVRRRRATRR
jgi:predicted nucleic acid-binding protein